MKKILYFSIILVLITILNSGTNVKDSSKVTVKSPGGKVIIELIAGSDSMLYYAVKADGKQVIEVSRFGIVCDNLDLGTDVQFGNVVKRRIDENYPLSGGHKLAVNKCNEITIPIRSNGENWFLDVRAYDDGVALRSRLPAQKERHIRGETTEWKIPTGSFVWYQTDLGSYEGIFLKTLIDTLSADRTIGLPITGIIPTGHYIFLSEANLVDYSDLAVRSSGDRSFKAYFHAERDGWKTDEEVIQPWRTTIITKNLNDLVNSDMIKNLCPPPDEGIIGDWIKPGRAGWNWWSTPSLIYDQQHQWIDWTRRLGFEYYLIDAGWTKWRTETKNAWDCLAEVVQYGKSKGVDIWIWIHSREVADDKMRKSVFKNSVKAGVSGIKIDFVPKCTRDWSNWYDATLKNAADYKLMIDFHGSVKPTGRDRTWPNELTREAVRGHEWHINRYKRTLTPDHDCIIPFNRFVQGAADYTPTVFNPEELRGYTWSREIAQAIVFTSPLLCYADHPENYLKNPALDILKSIPSTWDQTVVLSCSKIGECAAFARRKGETWFAGIINGSSTTEIDLPLDFLQKGTYSIKSIEDQPGRNDAAIVATRDISNRDKIKITIRPAGGFVAQINKN